jgi:protein-disulfide isomerase
VANVATIAACACVAYVALGARVTRTTSASPPIEEVRNVTTPLPRQHVKGDPRADIVVIEFTDFQCPFCGQHARDAFPTIQRDLINTGQVRWAVRHFPLDIHPMAYDAAKAASCAGQQERYWHMYDRLFELQSTLTTPTISAAAEEVGLSRSRFEHCMSLPADDIDADKAEAERLGIYSTPTFLVGDIDADGSVHVKMKVRGATDIDVFKEVIAKMTSANRK